jgi:hypothetical protein
MRTERAHCAVHRHEPHVRPGDLFADRLGANGIVLIALHIGLQTGGFSRTSWPSAPEVRATNNVTTHRPRCGLTRRQLLEKNVAPLDLTTEDEIALHIDDSPSLKPDIPNLDYLQSDRVDG